MRDLVLRRNKCPKCGQRITDYIIDVSACVWRCEYCEANVPLSELCTDTTVSFLAELISEEHRNEVMHRIGYEKYYIRRTSKYALAFLIGIFGCGIVFGILLQWHNPAILILSILICAALVGTILGYYKAEEKPRWRKIRA